jgi:phage-related protein
MKDVPTARVLYGVGSSKRDLLRLPDAVVNVFGYAFYLAQIGRKHEQAKPLKGFGSAGILEVVEGKEGNTYRGVYRVRFPEREFVLHVFQKKSKRGAATPKAESDLIRDRLRRAELIGSRGRDGDCSPPPARTRTGAINASGSYRRENGEGQRIS